MITVLAILSRSVRAIGRLLRLTPARAALVAAALLSAAAALLPSPAHAFSLTGFITGVLGGTIGFVAFVISYIVSAIVGFFTAIVVFGIGVVLQLNTNIINSVAVQEGFKVTLAIANLGFVLGIIVIAIATILRYEHYGMKRLLVKLVAAALLVNFSLVIGGSIINFSDRMSGVFLKAFPGGGGGATAFANAFAGAFGPHRPFLNQTIQNANTISSPEDLEKMAGAGHAGQSLGMLFVPLINLIFVAAILIVMLITISTFFFMLLVRYVYLGMLLILMPFAWLLWVFPLTEGMWKKWWDKFLKWTFFAPISLFFMWLVIITGQVMSAPAGSNPISSLDLSNPQGGGLQGLGYISPDPSWAQGLKSFVGSGANQVLGTFLQAAILVGLAIGGLIAAEKFSIVGSHAAMGAVKAVGKAAQGYAVRRGKQAGGALLQKARMPAAANKLMTAGYGTDWYARHPVLNKLATWTGVKAVHHGFKFAGQKAGEAMQQLEMGATGGLVKDEATRLKAQTANMTTEQKANLWRGANMPSRIALAEMAAKDPKLAAELVAKGFGLKDKAAFKRYGKEDVWNDVDKASRGMASTAPYANAIQEKLGKEAEAAGKKAEAEKEAELRTKFASGGVYAAGTITRMEGGVPVQKTVWGAPPPPGPERDQWIEEKLKEARSEIEEAGKGAANAVLARPVPTDEIDPETGKPVLDPITGEPKQVVAQAKIDEILREKVPDMKKGDKAADDKLFGGKEAFGFNKEIVNMMAEKFADKVARSNQQLVSNIMPKLSAQQLRGFEKMYKRVLKEGIANTAEGSEINNYLIKGDDRFEKTMANYMTGAEREEAPAAAPAPTPPSGGDTSSHATT